MRNFGDTGAYSLHASMQFPQHSAPGGIALVREHYTVSQLVQCSLNGVTPLSNKPERGQRPAAHC